MPLMRLQKFLSTAGICSRRRGEAFIKAGRVSVNGQIVVELGTKIDPDKDQVSVDGQLIKYEQHLIYIVLNKPVGYVTSCRHPGEKIVLELVDIAQRVYPIGRLDKDSTGLLLLTNDGRLHHQLSHPSFEHEKEYDVTVAKPITDGALQKMAAGLPMMGGKTRPARVQRIASRQFRIVLKEGKNRQVRRMVRKVGNQVEILMRVRVAGIKLGRLPPGKWRHLTVKEKETILDLL
jgi:23S rRNA pseudouridine2605 synthase/23S rRNA pseudouridine2604 synthase